MKTAVVFQGGGALGAFGAGAWAELVPALADGELVAVAGASIGALNAAFAVRHAGPAPGDAAALGAVWRERIATPSFPFLGPLPWPVPPTMVPASSWNGFITGALIGTRSMATADWPLWQPLSGLARFAQPLHQRAPMWRWLHEAAPAYESAPGRSPLLAVAAVDVMAGRLRLFDSDAAPLTARHVAASSALPMIYDPVEIDGRAYWDGEVTRESVLPALLARLRETGRVGVDEPLRLVTIENFPQAAPAAPASGAEIAYRMLALMQLGKLEPPPDAPLRLAAPLRIVREPLPEDGVSGQFDYSPGRIERLIAQGREAARRALVGADTGAAAA